jgi:hypothetical protein
MAKELKTAEQLSDMVVAALGVDGMSKPRITARRRTQGAGLQN